MTNIQIYGVLPPPYGGISIFNKRFIYTLEKRGVQFNFYQFNKNQGIKNTQITFKHIYLKNLNFKKRIIHISGIPGSKNQILLIILTLLFRKKVIITIHNDRIKNDYLSLPIVNRMILNLFFRKLSYIISVTKNVNYHFLRKSYVGIIPAYIPPEPDEIDIDLLPRILKDIREKYKILITANAFRISFYNEEDLYGIDLSIELMKRLVEDGYNDIGFIFVIPEIGDIEYFQKMENLLKDYYLVDNFFFYTHPIIYPAVINLCDIFLRPTNTDGDSISIREALSLHTPTIASNVVSRPQGTRIFKNRNVCDLLKKTKFIIDNYDHEKKKIEKIEFDDNVNKILQIYNRVLNGK